MSSDASLEGDPAFEARIFHYLLFKANQASTAVARQEAHKTAASASPLAVLADAANDKDGGDKKNFPSILLRSRWKLPPHRLEPVLSTRDTLPQSALRIEPATQQALPKIYYTRIVSAIREGFPRYSFRLPQNAAWAAPNIAMLNGSNHAKHIIESRELKQRVLALEQDLRQEQNRTRQLTKALQDKKKKQASSAPPNDPKDACTAADDDESRPAKQPMKKMAYRLISNRPDLPDDVKEILAKEKKAASQEKQNLRKKIARLEKKVQETTQKLGTAKAPSEMSRKAPSQLPCHPGALLPLQ